MRGASRPKQRLVVGTSVQTALPWARLLLVAVSMAPFVAFATCTRGPSVVLRTDQGAAVRVWVEVANTPAARTQGLMYRRELAADAGMLFVFPDEQALRFWMKNTFISLDMLFIDGSGRVVGIVANARPMSTRAVGVDEPARYVLEVNGGFASRHGITAGARVEFFGVPEDVS